MSDAELQKLSEALKTLTQVSALEDVKEKLEDLKVDRKEYKEVGRPFDSFLMKSSRTCFLTLL